MSVYGVKILHRWSRPVVGILNFWIGYSTVHGWIWSWSLSLVRYYIMRPSTVESCHFLGGAARVRAALCLGCENCSFYV